MKLSTEQIQNLLEDLYHEDASLKEKESELRLLIDRLASAKPDVKPDDSFIRSLKSSLKEKAQSLSNHSMNQEKRFVPESKKISWVPFAYSLGGIAVIAVVAVVSLQTGLFKPKGPVSVYVDLGPKSEQFLAMSIHRMDGNAFGEIAYSPDVTSQRAYAAPTALGSSLAMNEMATKSQTAIAVPTPNIAAEDMVAVSDSGDNASKRIAIMSPYEQTIVEYIYKGDDLLLSDESLDVYKRTNGSFSAKQLTSVVQGLNLGMVNISSFDHMQVSDISLYQDKPYGYQIYLSPRNGSVSIDQNWEKWKDAYPVCMDGDCSRNQLKASDVPSDEELIRMTDTFLSDYGINHTSYGAGEVNRNWEMYASGQEGMAYIPDSVTVVYPLLVDGKVVYQNSELKVGLNVTVNIRVKKVSNVYGIQALSLDASSYQAITDTSAILLSAKQGGISSSIRYMDESTIAQSKKVEAELGTPTKGLVQIYQYKDDQSIELYVPALFFPVTKKPDGQIWSQDMIVVPLVKGIESDVPQVMPMMRTGGGSSGSSGGVSVGTASEPAPAIDPVVEITAPSEPKK